MLTEVLVILPRVGGTRNEGLDCCLKMTSILPQRSSGRPSVLVVWLLAKMEMSTTSSVKIS